jgi:hypothetical protein
MSGLTFEQLRIPVALVLVIVAAFVFLPRGDGSPAAASATPTPAITVGEPGGAIIATPEPTTPPTPIPTVTPEPTPVPTPVVVADAFSARVAACAEISGSTCRGEFTSMPRRLRSFTALVTFTDARAGDTISVTLTGPSLTVPGGPYTLQGGGDGYYYSTFRVRLPPGEYTLTATRNGTPVATTTFVRRG